MSQFERVRQQMKSVEDFPIYNRKQYFANEFIKNATKAWHEVFPRSACEANGDAQGNFVIFHGHLANRLTEYANSLLLRDPLAYVGVYRGEALGLREELVGVWVKSPAGSKTVYHLSQLELLAFYRPTYKTLLDRFYDVRRLVLNNREGLKECGFDVNEKLGV